MTINITNVDDVLYQEYKRVVTEKGMKLTVVTRQLIEDSIKKYLEENK